MDTIFAKKASLQQPGAQLPSGMTVGVHYWKCPETTDIGYWHDHAHDILCDVDSLEALDGDHTKANKLHKFIFAITTRLFCVPWPQNAQFSYVTQSGHHRLVVGSEFHVIIRLENSKAPIFYTGKKPPKQFSPSLHDEALGIVDERGTSV